MSSSPAAPSQSRIDILDSLRGFALLGILAVNLPWFAHSVYREPSLDRAGDAAAAWLVAFAGQAKFFVLFSFLFGYGLAVQIERAAARGEQLGPRYGRRLLGIFAFGVVHAVFLFVGDILTLYAALGVVLWLVRRWTVRSLVALAAAALALSVSSYAALGWLDAAASTGGGAEIARLAAEADRAYSGSFLDASRQRLRDLVVVYPFLLLYNGPAALSMFALGLAAGKARLFSTLERHWPRLRRALPPMLALGVVGNAIYATVMTYSMVTTASSSPAWLTVAAMALAAVAAPALSFAYVVGLISAERAAAERRRRFEPILRALRAAGRMSLTNYMGQSILAGFLFLGWGLGLYGRVGLLGCLLLTPVIFGVLVAFSSWWLRRFRNGPEEWLLRSWTYGRWMPFRQAPPRVAELSGATADRPRAPRRR